MQKQRGAFYVFEGLDGSGHTTQAEKFKAHLEALGRTVLLTHEPTDDTEAGQRIRRILQHKEPFPARAEDFQLLYVEDRRIHTNTVILPALEKGTDVIGDRYFLSTVAFGSIGGCDIEWLYRINVEFPWPDKTFIIDASPATCLTRINKRGTELEFFEKQAKFGKAQETYRAMPARHENVFLVDGEPDIETVFKKVISL